MNQRTSGRAGRRPVPGLRARTTQPDARSLQPHRSRPAATLPSPAITTDTVAQWIQHLREEGQGLQHLRFDLHDDLPTASLKAFLDALDALPALQSLEVGLVRVGTPEQVAACRHGLAASLVCLQLSLEVRRYLKCRDDWGPFDELHWQDFFDSLHCSEVPSRDRHGLSESAQAHLRAMATIACRLGEGPLLKALKTVCPTLCLRFAAGLPTRRQLALVLQRRIPICAELLVDRADLLPGLYRLLCHPRLRLVALQLNFQVFLDKQEAARLLAALMKARHLNALSLRAREGVCIDWPDDLVHRQRAASAGLGSLTLHLLLFENRRDLAASFVQAWSPTQLKLHFHRQDEWALLSEERFAQALTRVSSLRLRVDDFAVYGDLVFNELRQRLEPLLRRKHSILDLQVVVSCSLLEDVPQWPDWQTMAERGFPLQGLSVVVRDRERDTAVACSAWRWSSEAVLREAHALSALPGAQRFVQEHTPLPKEVGDWILKERGLALREWLALSQISSHTRGAVLQARRRTLLAHLLRLASYGLLTEERLRGLAALGRFSAPDGPLLADLQQAMLAEGLGGDQLALVQRLLGELALQARVWGA